MKSAIFVVVRNEEALILEWIAHHLRIGFDACLVYDNRSTDRTADLARAAARHGDVRVIDWDRSDWNYQISAYLDALARFGGEFDWMAFIDSDEFIRAPGSETVSDLLQRSGDAAGLVMNWAIFGSSGHTARPDGLTTAAYLRRAADGFGPNHHVKMLVRPDRSPAPMNPHAFRVEGDVLHVSGAPAQWAPDGVSHAPNLLGWRVNHYFTRSRSEWDGKIRRGYPDIVRQGDEFAAYDRNEVFDDDMLRHREALTSAVERMMG